MGEYVTDRERLEAQATVSQLRLADALKLRLTQLGYPEFAGRRALLLDLVVKVVGTEAHG